jgi:superoxide dismutase, Fe-Mn family
MWLFIRIFLVSAFNCSLKMNFTFVNSAYPFVLSPLPYTYDFLQPVLSSRILGIHHDYHQLSYMTKLNSYVSLMPLYNSSYLSTICLGAYGVTELEKYAGGLYNHYLYWWTLTNPACSNQTATGNLLNKIQQTWGSFSVFVSVFTSAANNLFGNGWTWLCVNPLGGLEIRTTTYQVNPLMLTNTTLCYPILGLDLWEHAYYLAYITNKAGYIASFWTIVDWNIVGYFYDNFASKFLPVPF